MESLRISPAWSLRLDPRVESGHRAITSAGDEVLDNVTLKASFPSLSNQIQVPRNEFLAMVYLGTGKPVNFTASVAGEAQRNMTQAPGDICILGPRFTMSSSSLPLRQMIQYRIPGIAIRNLADHWKLGQVDSLRNPLVVSDPLLHHLSRVMCQLLERPKAAKATIGDHFLRSFYCHLMNNYGVQSDTTFEFSGGLSPRHKRIVEDALSDPLCKEITIENLAGQCGLSAGHFARVFRQTFGRPFHQHVLKSRIHRAKEFLRHSDLPLAEIAQAIGYADQATFTESFTRSTNISPGRFRRQYRTSMIQSATSPEPSNEAQRVSVQGLRHPQVPSRVVFAYKPNHDLI